ncbi:MAG: hypothetical protein K9K66_18255 [Desulfarculaceae bacterium]|nr:hypothetical protein [Desulfarculaceae bacterium]MCF8074420.1 hypothetical protein [Desulfarculaceae bacterium]MCF8103604.1 hypothetical protein [Desulfarculaceae bacterium]MCF8116017.1 hypothetical protein [Desulfarculaceae bacterium]
MSPYRKIDSGDIVAASPTRHFRFVFDPVSLDSLGEEKVLLLINFFARLADIENSIDIELLAPVISMEYYGIDFNELKIPWLSTTPADWEPLDHQEHQEMFRKNYVNNNEISACALYMLSMSEYCQADGIITSNNILIGEPIRMAHDNRKKAMLY